MPVCTFCRRTPAPVFALTVRRGSPRSTKSWQRHTLPVCSPCHRLLAAAGREGRSLKATWERWYLGHTVGIFDSRAANALHHRAR